MAKPVLDVVAEDPEVEHVAEKVQPARMQELLVTTEIQDEVGRERRRRS